MKFVRKYTALTGSLIASPWDFHSSTELDFMSSNWDDVSGGGGNSSTRKIFLPDEQAETATLCLGELREFLEGHCCKPREPVL